MQRYYVKENTKEDVDQPQKLQTTKKPEDGERPIISKRVRRELVDDDPFPGPVPVPIEKLKKYQRGKRIDARGIKAKFHKNALIQTDKKIRESVRDAARSELFLLEEAGYLEPDEGDDTYRVKQQDITSAVDITSAAKSFSLYLKDFGPYKINYSRDGRHLLLGGYRGHVAAFDFVTKRLLCEINVMKSVHDLCWLHIPTMFATAQKDHVYIYSTEGTELHCIKKLHRVLQLEFLPYHFLLAASSEKGFLSWLDVSIGKMIAHTYTNAGRLNILTQNPYNALVVTGHANGSVSMWSPNVITPLVRMLCHPHPIRAIAVDHGGQYMATAGIDRVVKIWDLRTYKHLQSYRLGGAPGFMNFSQKGLLSLGIGNVVEVYKDCCAQTASAPYMRHKASSVVSGIQFCPHEDVLGIGHGHGFESILIPGAGEPNFDSYESNPFMTKSQRREMEVKSLLEKIPAELITENPSHLGAVNVKSLKEIMEKKAEIKHVKPRNIEFEPRHKSKGQSKSARTFKRKRRVQEEHRRGVIKEVIGKKENKPEEKKAPEVVNVLDRFRPKNPN